MRKGQKLSAEHIERIRQANTGRKHTQEELDKMSESKSGKNNPMYGKHHTEEEKKKLSEIMSGQNNPMCGIHLKHTAETKEKMSIHMKARIQSSPDVISKLNESWKGKHHTDEVKKIISDAVTGEKHAFWKGDDVGRGCLHKWVRRHLPKPHFCVLCNKAPPIDVSNISGKYLRDLSDWQWVCRLCHYHFDIEIHMAALERRRNKRNS